MFDEKAIFEVASQLDEPSLRERYLSQVCGGNEQLRTRIGKLLQMDQEDPGFLESSPVPSANHVFLDGVFPPGSEVGRYRLRERIGEGGMGVVYVAEQTEPVRRKVALKIIKPGMATKDIVARFEAERQALAMMDHPNIARVFDGGVTDSGQPYFVMELVQGLPITEYSDACKLSTTDRLQLFAIVCRAVQHAHQKGVIHRDLKPSNVIVADIDDTAVPKIIDFGVAKAVSQTLTANTLYTHFSQLVGTPLYMSPEQTGLGVIDVDTRSDVYSLGVLLYELLTGRTPFDRDVLKQADFDEMRRIIREAEPARPSVMITTLSAEVLSTVSQRRGTDPRTLSNRLEGELDWLVMKALEKDRNRRYESASALAADVDRFLKNEPILAKSPSAVYRMRKFVRRNRVLVASLSAVFVALSLGAALATVAFVQAGQQRDLAESRLREISKEQAGNRELIELLSAMYPRPWGMRTLGRNQTVYDSIEQIAPSLESRLGNHPAVEVELRQVFAGIYMSAGKFDKARDHLQKALQRAEQLYGDKPHVVVADIHAALADEVGWNLDLPVDFNRLLEHAEKAIEIYEALGVESGNGLFAKAQCLLYTDPSRKVEMVQAMRKCVEVGERKSGRISPIGRWDLGLFLMKSGDDRLDEALTEFETALRACADDDTPPIAKPTVLSGKGRCLRLKGDIVGAIKAFEASWRLFQANELRNEPRGHQVAFPLIETYFAHGDLQKAFALIDEVEEQLTSESAGVESLVDCLFLKGWLLYQLENFAGAEALFKRSMELAREHLGEQHAGFIFPCAYLGLTFEAQDQNDKAAKILRRVLPLTQTFIEMTPGYDRAYWLHARAVLASADKNSTQLEHELDLATKGHAFIHAWPRPWFEPALQLVIAQLRFGLDSGHRQAAIELLKSGLENAQEPRATYLSSRRDVPTTRCELERLLVQLYLEEGNASEARKVHEQAVQLRENTLGADHIQTALARLRLGEFLVDQSAHFESADAEQPLVDAYENLKRHREAVAPLRSRAARKLSEVYEEIGRPQDVAERRAKTNGPSAPKQASNVE